MHGPQTQFSSARFWRGLHVAFGVPTTAVVAVAGASGLADTSSANTVAIVALVAAALTAVMTTLNGCPERRAIPCVRQRFPHAPTHAPRVTRA